MRTDHSARHLVFVTTLLLSAPTLATNGYFSHGYGIKSQGIAGIGIALPQDALAAAANPAGTALVGDELELGVSWFKPDRSASITGSGVPGANGSYDGNGKSNFIIPEAGYTKQLSDKLGAGVAVWGNGGMNTNYQRNPFAAFGASGVAGVDFQQLFVSSSLAYKPVASHSFGVAAVFAYQKFKGEGIQPFAFYSASPADFSNRGYDSSTGWGVRLGWTGKLTSQLTAGVTWGSKIHTGKFKKYQGLFAENGGFDIPENYGAGLTWQPVEKWQLAVEGQRINYSKIQSVGNSIARLFAPAAFGTDNGPGFGWRDVTVWKFGVSTDINPQFTVRAGFSKNDNPIPENETFLNILAPGVVKQHWTAGATWHASKSGDLSLSCVHAPKNTVHGAGSIPGGFGGGEANISLAEDIVGIAWSWKY